MCFPMNWIMSNSLISLDHTNTDTLSLSVTLFIMYDILVFTMPNFVWCIIYMSLQYLKLLPNTFY